MTIGENIKAIRQEKGLTQKQLGERLGISQAAIGQFEQKNSNPTNETIKKIAEALEVSEWRIQYGMSEEEVMQQMRINRREYAKAWNKKRKETEFLDKMNSLQQLLNEQGKNKAIEQVELITKIPEYKKD